MVTFSKSARMATYRVRRSELYLLSVGWSGIAVELNCSARHFSTAPRHLTRLATPALALALQSGPQWEHDSSKESAKWSTCAYAFRFNTIKESVEPWWPSVNFPNVCSINIYAHEYISAAETVSLV